MLFDPSSALHSPDPGDGYDEDDYRTTCSAKASLEAIDAYLAHLIGKYETLASTETA